MKGVSSMDRWMWERLLDLPYGGKKKRWIAG